MQTILVVDDDIDLLFSVHMTLKKKQYNVIALSNCLAAIDTALSEQPDLVLLDVNLGACDGRDLCKALKTKHQLSVPVLLFSANGEYATATDDYGADGFIQKPFGSAEFIDFIHHYLQSTN